ncbi:MAG: sugar transferase [Elusimicrobia bacterium]|nr:sugar transferase [Elusimicrobiota bacterium]
MSLIFRFFLALGDIILLHLSFVGAYYIRFYWTPFTRIIPPLKGIPAWHHYQQLFYLTLFLWLLSFLFSGFYKKRFFPALDEFIIVLKGTTFATVLTMAITFLYREAEFSRIVLSIIWGLSSLFIFIWHEAAKTLLRLATVRTKNVLVVGRSKDVNAIKRILKRHGHIRPYFLFEYGDENEIIKYADEKNISEVFTTISSFTTDKLLLLSDMFEKKNVQFKIVPDLLQLRQGEILIDESLGMPVFTIRAVSLAGINFLYKRVFDVIVSLIALSVLFPFLLMIAILIKITSFGSILYMHNRMGYMGKIFKFYKFRTMLKDAEAMLEKIKHLSEREGPVFKMKNDPRITLIGRFLRRFSIDEIPQLINVLQGDMSLVGPRPQVLWETAAYDTWAKRRLRVLPGVTGLWQTSGRASLSYEEMIELDIYYIENWSLGMDLKILFKTLPAIFSKKGSY